MKPSAALNYRHCLLSLIAVCFMVSVSWQALYAEEKDIYATEIVPMSPAECGRCHAGQFAQIAEEGGHDQDCLVCHEIFHAYNPRKDNYNDLMPRCEGCHAAVHGDVGIGRCLSCHGNAHAPARTPSLNRLAGMCQHCHTDAAQTLERPSAHQNRKCVSCHHTEHRFLPPCLNCHAPHYPEQASLRCLSCHPPHLPNAVILMVDSDSRNCHGCHQNLFAKWSRSTGGHGTLNCALCHTEHRYRPTCAECHGDPHDETMTAGFRSCLSCHLDAHNLPLKVRER